MGERRGSVGSVNSEKSGKDSPAAAVTSSKKPAVATPKSSKKQVTKPEKTEAVAEEDVKEDAKTPASSGRGRKRKTDTDTPASDKKAKTKKEAAADDDDTKEFSDYDSGNNETQPLRKKPKKEEKKEDSKESLTTKQQTAVAAALAAGYPGADSGVSVVWRTQTLSGRSSSSVLLPTMIIGGSILARRGTGWLRMPYSMLELSAPRTTCCHSSVSRGTAPRG